VENDVKALFITKAFEQSRDNDLPNTGKAELLLGFFQRMAEDGIVTCYARNVFLFDLKGQSHLLADAIDRATKAQAQYQVMYLPDDLVCFDHYAAQSLAQ
jgi:hypothetical protein